MVHRDYASSPRPSEYSPSSFWAQRSAQPAGIHKNVLSKCIRIVIVAFGSAPILDYRRFAHGLRWAAAQTCLRDCIPQTPFFASRSFKILSQQSVPKEKQAAFAVCFFELNFLFLSVHDPLRDNHHRQPSIQAHPYTESLPSPDRLPQC